MRDKRAGITALAAVAGVLLVAVLVTWAATVGPSGVLTGEGPDVVRLTPTDETSSPTDIFSRNRADDGDQRSDRSTTGEAVVHGIAYILEALLVLGILFLLWRGARRAIEALDARRRPQPETVAVDFEVLAEARRALTEQIDEDAGRQRAVLLSGSARNAIVECWHRFEEQASAAGLARHSWETSSEFTLRMLDLAGADTGAVARLAAAYREARFSEHEIDESTRAAALAALDEVHRGLFGRAR